MVSKLYDEVKSELSDYDDYTDSDFIPESKHSFDSELEMENQEREESNNEEEDIPLNQKFYCGKNRYKSSTVPANHKLNIGTRKKNLVKVLLGLKGSAKSGDVADPLKI